MGILTVLLALAFIVGIPGGLIAWFVVSLVQYIKAPVHLRKSKVGMLIASSVTSGVILTLGLWLFLTFMQDLSYM